MLFSSPKQSKLFSQKMQSLQNKNYLPEELLNLLLHVYEAQLEQNDAFELQFSSSTSLPSEQDLLDGRPVLERSQFPFNLEQAKQLFDNILNLSMKNSGQVEDAARTIKEALSTGELDLETAIKNFLKADDKYFRLWGEKTPSAPRMLSFLIQSSLMPCIEYSAQNLINRVSIPQPWNFGHCPVCASQPLIGQIQDEQGLRYLTCSFCHFAYQVPRLSCPFCAAQERKKQDYFYAPEEPGYRVEVCTNCGLYIKTADFRKLDKKSLPELDDLESLPLDILAQKQGYLRSTYSAWGF